MEWKKGKKWAKSQINSQIKLFLAKTFNYYFDHHLIAQKIYNKAFKFINLIRLISSTKSYQIYQIMIESISFKNQNRQKPPTWSNRFRRDVNDLMYTPKDLRDIQYVKKGHSPNQKQKRSRQQRLVGNNPMKNAMEKYNIKPYNLEDSPNIKMRRSLSTRQGNNRQNPEQALHTSSTLRQKIYSNPKNSGLFLTTDFFSLKRSQSTSDLKPSTKKISLTNNYGLSHFEFGTTTIQGKIHSKYGYSLSLSKCKTQKINNTNLIFYNKNKDIQFHEHEKRNIIQKLAKYRNFKSYPPHNLYEENVQAGDGGMLDRFYDVTDRNIDMVRKKLCLDVDFNKISPRPDISKKLGTQLDYPHSYTQIAQSNTHRPLYDTQKIQRQLIIGKQVINSSKGCTR